MLDIQYTKQGLKDLKYVIVKMAPESSHAEGTKGLFLGYGPIHLDSKDMFLWLYKDECAYLFNLKHYDIKMIEIALNKAGRTAEIKIYDDTLQKEALARIIMIKEALKDQSRLQKNDLVDIATYESIPLAMKLAVDNTDVGTETELDEIRNRSWDSRNKTTSPYTAPYEKRAPYVYTAKEVKTTYIKRTTRYSVTEALTQMQEKIERIRKGTYLPPKLRKKPITKEGEKQASNPDPDEIGFIPYG